MGKYGGERFVHDWFAVLVWQAFLLEEFLAWYDARGRQG